MSKRSVRRTLREQIHNSRFEFRRIVRPVAVDLPRLSGEGPVVRLAPRMNRIVGFLHPVVGAQMYRHRHHARWSLGRVNLAGGFKRARDLNAEVHVHRLIAARGVVI